MHCSSCCSPYAGYNKSTRLTLCVPLDDASYRVRYDRFRSATTYVRACRQSELINHQRGPGQPGGILHTAIHPIEDALLAWATKTSFSAALRPSDDCQSALPPPVIVVNLPPFAPDLYLDMCFVHAEVLGRAPSLFTLDYMQPNASQHPVYNVSHIFLATAHGS